MEKSVFVEIATPPPETEELILVALDDHKFGVPTDYLNSAGLDQLSTFFIGYREADGNYYVVE